jgi:hypothetical protein
MQTARLFVSPAMAVISEPPCSYTGTHPSSVVLEIGSWPGLVERIAPPGRDLAAAESLRGDMAWIWQRTRRHIFVLETLRHGFQRGSLSPPRSDRHDEASQFSREPRFHRVKQSWKPLYPDQEAQIDARRASSFANSDTSSSNQILQSVGCCSESVSPARYGMFRRAPQVALQMNARGRGLLTPVAADLRLETQ